MRKIGNFIKNNLIDQKKTGDKLTVKYGFRDKRMITKKIKYMGTLHRNLIRDRVLENIDPNYKLENNRIKRISKFDIIAEFNKFDYKLNFKKYETPNKIQLSRRNFINNIKKQINNLKDSKNRQVSVKLKTPAGGDIFRTISGVGAKNDDDLIRELDNFESMGLSSISGSDKYVEGSRLDTSFVGITSFAPLEGGSTKTKKYKNIAGDYYISRNFSSHKSNKNNCLIDCIRSQTDEKLPHSSRIRDNLGIERGEKIKINEIEKFEDYIKKNINVISDTKPNKEVYFDDTKINERIDKGRLKFKDLLTMFRTRVEETPNFVYKSKKKYGETLLLMLKDEHYSVVIRNKSKYCKISGMSYRKKKPTKYQIQQELIRQGRIDYYFNKLKMAGYKMKRSIKKTKDVEYLPCFFDFETIYNEECVLVPYAVVYKISGREVIFYKGFDCLNKFMKDIMLVKERLVLIGYNSSRFDNFFIAQYCFEKDFIKNNSVFYVQNSILQLRFGQHKVFDLCRILMCPLKKACDSFKTKNKKIDGFSHDKMQKLYREGKLEKFLKKKTKELEEYNKMDVLALEELYYKTQESCKKLIDDLKLEVLTKKDKKFNLYDYFTISSLAFHIWQRVAKKYGYSNHILAPKTQEIYDNMRSSMTAGRTEVFYKINEKKLAKCLLINDGIRAVDVTSLYPFVMEKYQYPKGDSIKTNEYVKGKLGIYRCNILKQPKKNIFPKREKGEPLNWKSTKPIMNQWLTSVDIECMKKYNSKLEVFEGYYWMETFNPFKEYIKVFKEEKKRQDFLRSIGSKDYNGALREMTKLFQNAMSGKVNQRIFKDNFSIVSSLEEYRKFMMKNEVKELTLLSNGDIAIKGEKRNYIYNREYVKPCQFGMFIYSYSRRHMYENIISKYDVIYMDTDSAFLKLKDYENFVKENPELMGSEFGQLKEEIGENKGTPAIFIAPKCYLVEAKKEKNSKRKFKGINKNDKWLRKEDFKKMKKDGLSDKEIYKRSKKVFSYEMFKEIYDINTDKERSKDKIVIFCKQILKKKIIVNKKNGKTKVFQLIHRLLKKEIGKVGGKKKRKKKIK